MNQALDAMISSLDDVMITIAGEGGKVTIENYFQLTRCGQAVLHLLSLQYGMDSCPIANVELDESINQWISKRHIIEMECVQTDAGHEISEDETLDLFQKAY